VAEQLYTPVVTPASLKHDEIYAVPVSMGFSMGSLLGPFALFYSFF